jgi:hypothetical protein
MLIDEKGETGETEEKSDLIGQNEVNENEINGNMPKTI